MILAVLTGFVVPCRAGDPRMVLPDDVRVEDVKSPADFFGFEIGSRHLRHDQVHAYLLYLSEHNDRASAIHYGHTHGGRPLSALAISSPKNIDQLDSHEMGGNSTFIFQPGVPARTNPLTPDRNRELTRLMSLEHAKAMDGANELYFTEEQFDDFYLGKGSTYPDLHGAVGILFEQGSTRGLRLVNDLTNRHFRDTVANQVRTSLSSLRGAASLKSELLEFQRDFYQQSLSSGQSDPLQAYVLTGSTSRVAAAHELLRRHSVRSYVPSQSILLNGESFASGQAETC